MVDSAILALFLGFALYLCMVRAQRFRNLRMLKSKYAQYLQNPYAMSYKTAYEIVRVTIPLEFRSTFETSTAFALLKSFAIPSGTRLLVQTRQLTAEDKIGKRTEDTGILLTELFESGIDSERGLRAISKINWLHGRYGSRITNDEMIHTLALFVLEPIRWVDEWEWRPMIDLEKAAFFIYWREIGHRMGIKSIPSTLDDLRIWTTRFEKTELHYDDNNRVLMEASKKILLKPVPRMFHSIVWNMSASLLESHVRVALGVEDPPSWISTSVGVFLKIRATCIRRFCLPRTRVRVNTAENPESGRIYRTSYIYEPWYLERTWWSRIKGSLLGKSNPTTGPESKSDGYLPEELGPVEYEMKSKEGVLREAAEMKEYAEQGGGEMLGCPFVFSGRIPRS